MTKVSGCSWQPLVKKLCSTQAEEKEQEKSSGKQWEGQAQYQGPRAQHKAIPQTCPSVLPGVMLRVS